ncbi:E2 domain-containing protein [Azorhizobium caulinodans]|uniref:E2 domain-containing protein n=1 Tax=Azorhizobium caulinodans TaxID=7 RepID=UPI002FBD89C1
MTAFEHLKAAASSFHAVLVSEGGDGTVFRVQPPEVSGRPGSTYLIAIEEKGGTLLARELEVKELPAACPERHINFNGSFCLYWGEAEPLSIDSPEAAHEWWGKLTTFLLRQRVAGQRRSWPGKAQARAHGPAAARFQARAEAAASILGDTFRRTLGRGGFTTCRRYRVGEHRIRLFRDGRKIATAIEELRRVMTLRMLCLCNGASVLRLPLGKCGDHGAVLAEFIIALDGWKRAEEDFFRQATKLGMKCCGSIDGCPLAEPAAGTHRKSA